MNRIAVAAIIAIAVSLLAAAEPSGATVYDYEMTMVDGSIDLNDFMTTPSDFVVEGCPGEMSMTGTIDATTDTVTSNLALNRPFVGFFDNQDYVIEASAAATTHGTYSSASGEFSGLHFTTISFVMAEFDRETCTTGEEICLGSGTLTLDGGLNTGATLPLTTGEEIYVNGSGSISVPFSTCTFIWWLLLNGADIAIGPNTETGIDPGAIFEQV